MAGDPTNAGVWSEADVLTAGLAIANPVAGADFVVTTGNWSPVGILDGGQGFAESQSFDNTEFYGWGFGVIASSKKNLKISKSFTALEDNLTTLGLAYDADDVVLATGDYAGDLAARNLNLKFKVAFETRNGTAIRRLISKNYAMIAAVGDASEGEDSLMTRQITVDIFPDASKVYWEYFKGEAS